MKRLMICLCTMVLCCGVLNGCGCIHEWQDATCIKPQTCIKCGKSKGEALGHDWSEATCAAPKTCKRCKGTQASGPRPSHEWIPATCDAPKTCRNCGATQGSPKEHVVREWEIVYPTTTTEGTRTGVCRSCKRTITETIPCVNKDDCSIVDFIDRYNAMADFLYRNTGVYLDKIDKSDIKNNTLQSPTGATIVFNENTKNEDIFEYEIDSFRWERQNLQEMAGTEYMADWYCTVAGFIPESTIVTADQIITPLIDQFEDNVYCSIEKNQQIYRIMQESDSIVFDGSDE